MANIFQRIASAKPNSISSITKTENSKKWFREVSSRISEPLDSKDIIEKAPPFSMFDSITEKSIGKMYFFLYDAKNKDILSYWDRFPLVFPIEIYNDGFLGINLHYLPRFQRAVLMDALYVLANNDKMDSSTVLKISYEILSKSSRFKLAKPCIKRYLNRFVQSKFMYVNPKYWDLALMLPSEQFVGSSTQKVHKESLRKAK